MASEGVPFIKSGGLADVIGSLPRALTSQGIEARVVLPKYRDIPEKHHHEMELVKEIEVMVGWRNQYCGIYRLRRQETIYYFIENQYYYDRPGMYGYHDDAERFAFFCRGVIELLKIVDFNPDILHCHDWHTGIAPVFLADEIKKQQMGDLTVPKPVFTVHNLGYQGIFPREIMSDVLGLGDEYFTMNGLEFHGNVNYLKGGVCFSKAITTVSPTYAEEIQHASFGEGLDGLLRENRYKLIGILNGLDYSEYNPETDPHIKTNYSHKDLKGKQSNKRFLQEKMGLPVLERVPVIGIVSRLTAQKGIELIARVIHDMLAHELQIVVLGAGDHHYEELFKHMEYQYPHKLKANIMYDEQLARQIYAGGDFILIPSKFEPCGLSQMIGLRYGAIPIVRETGGLKDTVTPYNDFTDEGNGFSFANYNAHDMLHTIERALLFYHKKPFFKKLRKRGMLDDFSWDNSARQYVDIYNRLLDNHF